MASGEPKSWHAELVAARVERARGAYLARTGQELKWSDLGRLFDWSSPVVTQVRKGRRPLRVAEVGAIAELLGCSPGWLAYGEGTMWGATDARPPRILGEVPYEDGVPSEEAVRRREADAYPAPTPLPLRRVAEGRVDRATDAAGRGSRAPSPGKRPKR